MFFERAVDLLGFVFLVGEIYLLKSKRVKGPDTDSKSLRIIWRTVGIAMAVAFTVRTFFPSPFFHSVTPDLAAAGIIVCGLALRWYTVSYLGKHFTVNVTILKEHELVTTGPFRVLQHPSYTGLLLVFLGLGIHSNHPIGLAALTIPVFWAIKNRIKVEEVELARAFGEDYFDYQSKTKRLIPFIY